MEDRGIAHRGRAVGRSVSQHHDAGHRAGGTEMNTSFGNIKAVAKRELIGYFSSPVAYVFLTMFLLLGGFFTFMVGRAPFFDFGQASLVTFFIWLAWLFLFLVPAVGMRLWSEERRLGTSELLLSMPITAWQAIVGEFMASWLVLALELFLTMRLVITG